MGRSDSGTGTIDNLPPGNYDVWVRWANGECPTFVGSYTILTDDVPTVSISGNNTFCSGDTPTTVLTATGDGGTEPYTYIWSDNTTGPTLSPPTITASSVSDSVLSLLHL